MDKLALATFLLAITALSTSSDELDKYKKSSNSKEHYYDHKYPPCMACQEFVYNFKKNADYSDWNKTRERVCSDVDLGKNQCNSFKDEHDQVLEEWWRQKREEESDLEKYLCIEKLEVCCPNFHYGPSCTPCEGYPGDVCSKNGVCKGHGTRKGNGKCRCFDGYTGDKCATCESGYFQAYRDDKKLLCSKCHHSCDGACSKPGPEGCEKCKAGWLTDKEKGCMDINECAAPKPPCRINQFCVNTDGSFECLKCDASCHSCTGDGPDMCKKCASGFVMKEGMCVDADRESRKTHMYVTRYLTYLGLCVATCIIFNKNTVLAAVIGIVVAVYISMSEYVLNSNPTPKTDNIAQSILNKLSG